MSRSDAKELEAFLAALAAKDRLNVERHLTAIDEGPAPSHGKLWRQIAAALRRLAPHAAQTIGQHVVQFFIADGKYRKQVFTLEDQRDGLIQVYVPDVLAAAIKEKILGKALDNDDDLSVGEDEIAPTVPVRYPIIGKKNETLQIDALDAANTPEPPNQFKNMLGWGRKALRVTIPTTAGANQAAAVIAMAQIAGRAWEKAAAEKA
jgi:hypothetical protein